MRAALTILGVAIGVMVVMVIGALISGFNKGVSDMLEQSGPKTFYVARWWSAGVTVSDGSDESSPWRRNPPMKIEDAKLIQTLPSVSFVSLDEGTVADIQFENRTMGSVSIRGAAPPGPRWPAGTCPPAARSRKWKIRRPIPSS